MSAPAIVTRREVLAGELREAGVSFLRGHDNELKDHLRRALALAEGIERGLP